MSDQPTEARHECVKCGHSNVNSKGECRQCIDWQKHICIFTQPPVHQPAAVEHERRCVECGHEERFSDNEGGICEAILDEDIHPVRCGHFCFFSNEQRPCKRCHELSRHLPTCDFWKKDVTGSDTVLDSERVPAPAPQGESPSDRIIAAQFHKVWTSQVGTEGYDKDQWQKLSTLLNQRGIRV